MNETSRIHWIDVARGFFIIAIVLGHVFNSGVIWRWVFSFHVPAFFFLSGYCFKYTGNFGGFVRKKVTSVAVPYFVFSVLSIVIFSTGSVLIPQIKEIMNCSILHNLLVMLYGNSKLGMEYNRPLWFLTCLLSTSLMAYVIESISQKRGKRVRYTAIAICVCLGIIENLHEDIAFPWHIETAFSMYVWYAIGISIKENNIIIKNALCNIQQNKIKQVTFSMLLTLCGGGGVCLLNIRTVGVRNDHYGIIPIYYIAALLGILGFILLSKVIDRNSILEYLGRNSLIILVLHKFPILVLQELVPVTANFLLLPNTVGGVLCGSFVVVVSIIFSLILGSVIKKFFPWAVGMSRI